VTIVLADRVMETTTTTGTGTVSLAGAKTGYRGFVAGAGASAVVYYTIAGQAGGGAEGEWEVGIGTVTDAAPDTLSRTTILSSSNAGAAVDFSAGTKDVFLTAPAASMGFSGALLNLGGNETTTHDTEEALNWTSEVYDVGGWHESITNPSRLTVPAGVDRVRITVHVEFAFNAVGSRRVLLLKGGVLLEQAGGIWEQLAAAAATTINMTGISAPLPVVAGNYFEIGVMQTSTTTLDVLAAGTWVSIEKVGP